MRIMWLAVLPLALVACGDNKSAPATGSGSAAGGGSGSAAAPAAPPAKGLANKDNDPAIVALAKDAIKCKADGSRLEWNCAGFKAWRDSKLLGDAKSDPTLANFLDDSDEKVRFLGADKLSEHRDVDPAIGKRVFAAAQAETSALVGEELGKALGRLDLAKVGVAADASKLVTGAKLPELEIGIIRNSAENPALFDAILAVANTSTDDKMKLAAENAFFNNTPSGKEADVCKMWFANVDATNAELAGTAAGLVGRVASCAPSWDALLDKVEAKAKGGTANFHEYAGAMQSVHDQKDASAAQKARAITIAKAIASNPKNDAFGRSRAIEFVGATDKGFAAQFKNDKEGIVKDAATKASK